jgi:hypothetical protein
MAALASRWRSPIPGTRLRSQSSIRRFFSGADPSFYRIYRGDQGAVVVMSAPLAIGSADDTTIEADGDMLGALFDEDAELVAVLHLPWY